LYSKLDKLRLQLESREGNAHRNSAYFTEVAKSGERKDNDANRQSSDLTTPVRRQGSQEIMNLLIRKPQKLSSHVSQ
jgi:hypothetical protein